MINKAYNYLPILALSTAEMSALEQLPDKDKDLLLPIFPLKGWVGSKTLDKTISRIEMSIGLRPWIADIDSDFVFKNKKYLADPEGQRPVFKEVHKLLDPTNGYENWVQYVAKLDDLVVPTLQTHNLEQLGQQIHSLSALNRGLVVRLKIKQDGTDKINTIIRTLIANKIENLLILLDFEDIKRSDVLQSEQYGMLVSRLSNLLPNAIFSTSASSFPSSFSGSYRGELPIYERQLHTAVCKLCEGVRVIYSDRGSARANKTNGGGGLPPARIDYPLKDDWRYVRKEFQDSSNVTELEKHTLYKEAATEIVKSNYWNPNLRVWGVQMIEKTVELRDKYCITSANRATAVRINIHLYQQLHYLCDFDALDTEEDWED
ncbi:TPA: beta family protein [Vibrio parahaemolyticus]|uniref:beta family protein n=1 Tax=Vibrio parahaemolyticus TaxID=670 RepID=UPI0006C5DDBA|nr:protein beta [Vibrio parahaemolyticus]HAS6089249.1 protein beta [Vibrio vulnificus]EGQ8939612.1 protein beta [Vibrio parahaemolyticus]EGQ8949216.1 protein beta [Vibrio parahaemolyticus]EGQ8969799.1 protein beta [Vibrio parahaemolyticus]EGR1589538.1 protein beta [Vibrio parahaemolyticus]